VRVADITPEELCRHMGLQAPLRGDVGRDALTAPEKARRTAGEAVLVVEDLVVDGASGRRAVDGVSLEVRAGEIVGLAAVAGNGMSELVAALAGLREVAGGRVLLAGRDVTRAPVAARRHAGLAYVPEDTGGVGLALGASIADNLVMNARHQLTRHGVLSRAGARKLAAGLIERFAIKASSPRQPVSQLSGGNRQKVVVARELSGKPLLLIAEQPTQGVDVGVAEAIQRRLLAARDAGRAVLLASADLGELTALADRVLVMFEGRVAGEVPGDEADEETLGLLAAGGKVAA
jgi:simple sugar transport system ATP-binding protein